MVEMITETYEKWQAKIRFLIPKADGGSDYEFSTYAYGKNPKELRKAVLEKIKYLESNQRVVKTVTVIHTLESYLTSTKEEYLSGKAKRDK
jgi:hypothetical protein